MALAPRRPRVAPGWVGRTKRPWPFPSAPRIARVAKAPRRPRVAPGGSRWMGRPLPPCRAPKMASVVPIAEAKAAPL